METARKELARTASCSFNGPLITFIDDVRRLHEQIIDTVNIDRVTFAGWDKEAKDSAAAMVKDFALYIQEHKEEITALRIFYSRPYSGRQLTYAMISELLEALKKDKPQLAPLHVWQAYRQVETVGLSPQGELTALVALVRRVTEIDTQLTPL